MDYLFWAIQEIHCSPLCGNACLSLGYLRRGKALHPFGSQYDEGPQGAIGATGALIRQSHRVIALISYPDTPGGLLELLQLR